ANTRTSSYPRERSSSSVTVPTAPVAPTTPMRGRSGKLERLVQCADRGLDLRRVEMAGDLDRRRRDDRRRDALALERRERLRRDAGVALHAGADDRDLAEVVASLPACAEPVERARGRRVVLRRGREDDLVGALLQDRVDVDVRVGERREETGGCRAACA